MARKGRTGSIPVRSTIPLGFCREGFFAGLGYGGTSERSISLGSCSARSAGGLFLALVPVAHYVESFLLGALVGDETLSVVVILDILELTAWAASSRFKRNY